MSVLALKISPVIIAFVVGLALQRMQYLDRRHGAKLLRIVVNVALPVLILASFSRMQLDIQMSFLPLAAILILVLTWPVTVLVGKWLQLPRPTLGSFVIAPMMMNLGFVYPFVLAAWGSEGFAILALFDFGNCLVIMTLVYALSCWYGAEQTHPLHVVREIITFPPFIALFVAVLVNLGGVPVPVVLSDGLHTIGAILILLVPLALGIYFNPRVAALPPLVAALVIRIGLGLLLGWLCVELLDLEGMSRAVVLLGAAAPVGFNSLVFAAQHHLDETFTAAMASLSLMLGLVYLPLMLYLLS